MQWWADVILGLVTGYLVASYLESFYHHHIQHGVQLQRFFAGKVAWLETSLGLARASHSTLHHRKTFRLNHVTQFTSEKERQDLLTHVQNKYPASFASQVEEEHFGLGLGLVGVGQFLLALLPPWIIALPIARPPFLMAMLLPMLCIPFLSSCVHRYLHMSYDVAISQASYPMALLLSTRYMKAVWRHHWLHHRYDNVNYNLLLGGDFIRGVHRTPNPVELKQMAKIGLPTQ